MSEAVDSDAARLSEALRSRMSAQGFTLRSLTREASALGGPISVAALGGWVRGISVPSEPLESSSLRALEVALEMEPGDLSMLLEPVQPVAEGTSRHTAPAKRPLTDYTGDSSSDARTLQSAAKELKSRIGPLSGPQHLVPQRVRTRYEVGADRRPRSATTTMTVRAMHDLVDCYWFLHAFTSPGSQHVIADEGCIVARKLSNHEQLEAAELVFPVQLGRGDVHTFSFRVDYSYEDAAVDDEPSFYARAFTDPLAEATLEIQFDAAPPELHECEWDLKTIEPGRETRRRSLGVGTRQASIRLRPPRPAAYGWSWRW